MALEIGTVRQVDKSAFGTPPDQDQRALTVRDGIYMDELVETVEQGAVRIRFLDGSDLRIGSAAEVTLDRFVYDPLTSDGALILNIQEGALRLITGQMNAAGIRIVTPSATIGIRGSDVLIKVLAFGAIVVAVLKGQAVISPIAGDGLETIVDRLGTATVDVLGRVALDVPPPQADPGMGRDLGALLASFRVGSEQDETATDFNLPDSLPAPPGDPNLERSGDEARFDKPPPFAAIEALFGFFALVLGLVPPEFLGPRLPRFFAQLTLQGEEKVPAMPIGPAPGFIEGSNLADSLSGGGDADTVYGLDGDDLLAGGPGDDLIFGGPGRDRLLGEAGDDLLFGGIGDDLGYGGEGSDGLAGEDGNDRLGGGPGNDSLKGDAGDDSLYGDAGDDSLNGNAGNDMLQGDLGNDSLEGAAGDDLLQGNDGSDQLSGSAGLDILLGGSGDDRLYGGGGPDLLDGGLGNDELEGDDGDDLLDGGEGMDLLVGGSGDDLLYGSMGDDGLHGGMGDDDLYGGAGKDILHGDDQDDLLFGGGGDDLLHGDLGNDQLLGDDGSDTLRGLDGNDTMIGGVGDDTLFGDQGRDVLTGGPGADLFVYRPGDGGVGLATADLITDYTDGLDRFGLTGGIVTFGQLTITQAGGDVSVSIMATGEVLFVIANEITSNVNPGDFVFL